MSDDKHFELMIHIVGRIRSAAGLAENKQETLLVAAKQLMELYEKHPKHQVGNVLRFLETATRDLD